MFGLKFHASTPLPWLSPGVPAGSADVHLELGPAATQPFRDLAAKPHYSSPAPDALGRPLFVMEELQEGAYLRLRYNDGAEFVIDRAGTRIFGSWGPDLSQADSLLYLFAPVSGLLLRLRGVTCLHASAVVVDGQALAFIGASGAGKSTLAAAFSRLGFSVLTDNIAALAEGGEQFILQPGAPRILLWPPSVAALWKTADDLPRILSTWDKRYLDLAGAGGLHDRPAPLKAIYLLQNRGPHNSVGFAPMGGAEALMQLTANTYMSYLLGGPQRARDFMTLSRLVCSVPVRRISRPDDLSQLRALCRHILEDFGRIRSHPLGSAHV